MNSKSEETIKKKIKNRWKLLNSFGVHTQEDLRKFNQKYKLDIGVFIEQQG